jgi:hypothetical protein
MRRLAELLACGASESLAREEIVQKEAGLREAEADGGGERGLLLIEGAEDGGLKGKG